MARPPEATHCRRCGHKHENAVPSKFCCLFAPDPTGWCAWCGDELKKLSFCDNACAKSYQEDAFMSNLNKQAPVAKRLKAGVSKTPIFVGSNPTGGT